MAPFCFIQLPVGRVGSILVPFCSLLIALPFFYHSFIFFFVLSTPRVRNFFKILVLIMHPMPQGICRWRWRPKPHAHVRSHLLLLRARNRICRRQLDPLRARRRPRRVRMCVVVLSACTPSAYLPSACFLALFLFSVLIHL